MRGFARTVLGLASAGLLGATALPAGSDLPAHDPKVRVTQQVLDDLVRAAGDGRTPPALRLLARGVASRHQVLWIDTQQNLLTVQEEVYDLCVAMGADSLRALAFLLGHELAHRYKDHDWAADFVRGAADLAVGRQLDELNLDNEQHVARETEADDWAGFYGALAGYGPGQAAPEILGRIHAAYGLQEAIPGYPTLAERQQIAVRSAQRLQRLVPVFEAGQLLAAVGRFEEAGRCFDHVATDFPSREILSQAGIVRALQALDLHQEGDVRFVYPFELDAATRLGRPTTKQRAGDEDALALFEARRRYHELLQEAVQRFEQARARDPAYAPALINLAAAHDLLGEADDALFWARKAIRLATDQGREVSLAHAYIVRAIAQARAAPQDLAPALADLARARAASPLFAQLNQAALAGRRPAVEAATTALVSASADERIDGVGVEQLESILSQPGGVTTVPRQGPAPALDIHWRQSARWWAIAVEAGYSLYVFVGTPPAYEGDSGRGVRVGDPAARVESLYGAPSRVVATTQGVDRVYERPGVIFRSGAGDRVRGWIAYAGP